MSYALASKWRSSGLYFLGLPALLGFPISASAERLVTCTGVGDGACDACALVAMMNNIIGWIMAVAVIIAAMLFVYAGFQLVVSRGDVARRESAKAIFINTIGGLVLLLLAWVVVDTIMKVLLDRDGEIGVWNEITCDKQPSIEGPSGALFSETGYDEVDYSLSGTAPRDTLPDGAVDPQDTLPSGSTGNELADSAARARLEEAGINTKSGVSYSGLQPHVIDRAIALKEQCDCGITVTSATDGNHASGQYSHERGFKLDFRTRDEGTGFKNYIENEFGGQSPDHYWSNGTPVYRNGNTLCAVESDHVDCAFRP